MTEDEELWAQRRADRLRHQACLDQNVEEARRAVAALGEEEAHLVLVNSILDREDRLSVAIMLAETIIMLGKRKGD